MGLFSKSKERARGNLTAQSQLLTNGIDLNFYKFNLNQDIELNKEKYMTLLRDNDLQQFCNRYIWDGLPPYLPSYLIENMLYLRGSLVGFYDKNTLKILPYSNDGNLNIYGLPTSVIPVAFNGQPITNSYSLPIKYNGELNSSRGQAVLLYDRIPITNNGFIHSRAFLNREILDNMAELLARVKNNVRNADKKIVYYCSSEGQKRAFYEAIKNTYSTDDPFIVVVKGADGGIESEPLHTDIDLHAQELLQTFQSLNSIRCQLMGIDSSDVFEKKERKITGELEGTKEQVEITSESGLYMRKLFIEQLKSAYPEHIDEISKIQVYSKAQMMKEEQQAEQQSLMIKGDKEDENTRRD